MKTSDDEEVGQYIRGSCLALGFVEDAKGNLTGSIEQIKTLCALVATATLEDLKTP